MLTDFKNSNFNGLLEFKFYAVLIFEKFKFDRYLKNFLTRARDKMQDILKILEELRDD